MIRNDQQRSVTAMKRDEARSLAAGGDDRAREVYTSFADKLDEQLREYDGVRAGYVRVFKLDALDDLVAALVKCRLARGWTQKDLAAVLGVAEQQVQRYESGAYEKAALWKVAEVIDVLGYQFEGVLRPDHEEAGGVTRWDVKNPFVNVAQAKPDVGSTTIARRPDASTE